MTARWFDHYFTGAESLSFDAVLASFANAWAEERYADARGWAVVAESMTERGEGA